MDMSPAATTHQNTLVRMLIGGQGTPQGLVLHENDQDVFLRFRGRSLESCQRREVGESVQPLWAAGRPTALLAVGRPRRWAPRRVWPGRDFALPLLDPV